MAFAEILGRQPVGEHRDLGKVAQQPVAIIRGGILTQGVGGHPDVRGDRGQQGLRVSAARVGWTIFRIGTCAMVWMETLRPSDWVATGITALWWLALSVIAYQETDCSVPQRGRAHEQKTL
jgi:hypothetical protein